MSHEMAFLSQYWANAQTDDARGSVFYVRYGTVFLIAYNSRVPWHFFWGIQGNKIQHPGEIPVMLITLYHSFFFSSKLHLGKRIHLLFNSYKEKNPNHTILLLLTGRNVVLLIKKKTMWRLWGSAGQMWSIVFNQKEKTCFSYYIGVLLIFFQN